MTREEQINTLTAIIQECEEYQWQRKETLYEIIKVLEKEPCTDAVSRKYLLSKARGGDWNGGGFSKEYVYIEDIKNAPFIIPVDNK